MSNKKIINNVSDIIPEMMEGFISANSNCYEAVLGSKGILYKNRRKEKVTLVLGGGSGHEPMFSGFVGEGLGDAAACGNVFTSPDPGTIVNVAKEAHGGKGVLFLYGNYAGDNMNFDMAEEILEDEGIKSAHVRVCDDVASAPIDRVEDRRGIAGDVFMIKIAGAACDEGLALDEVVSVCNKTMKNLRSIGLATSPGQIPGSEKPTFELGDNEIEFGMGIHGEPGVKRTEMKSANELVDTMYNYIANDMVLEKDDEVCVLINGLGSTTILEMSIVYKRLKERLDNTGINVYDSAINSYCTCMEMGGFSISILKLDDEIKAYYDKPCFSPYYAKKG